MLAINDFNETSNAQEDDYWFGCGQSLDEQAAFFSIDSNGNMLWSSDFGGQSAFKSSSCYGLVSL